MLNDQEDVCVHGIKLVPFAPWKCASYSMPLETKCTPRTFRVPFQIPIDDRKPIILHRKCTHNEEAGLVNRYLAATPNNPAYDQKILDAVLDEFATLVKPHFNGMMHLKDFIKNKKGRLRARYDDAVNKVLTSGFNLKKDNYIKAFLKSEIFNEENKTPRNIMGRCTKFNLVYAMFVTPLEEAILHIPEIFKGKTLTAMGDAFYSLIYGEKYMMWDMTKFEASQQEKPLYDIEMGTWKRLITDIPILNLIYNIWKAKMIKRGFYPTGVEFFFLWCRGSGDMDTGLFNTILNWVATRYFEIVNNLPARRFGVTGDDGIRSLPNKVDPKTLINTYELFGFKTELIPVSDYHDLEFCSSKFIMYNKSCRFILIPNIKKTLNNIGFLKNSQFEHCIGDYYYSLGYMYKTLYPGFPIFEQLSNFLMNIGSNEKKRYVAMEILQQEKPYLADIFVHGLQHYDIEPSFIMTEYYMSYGLSPVEIENIITYLDESHIIIPETSDRKFKKSGDNKNKFQDLDYDVCEQILLQACKTFDSDPVSTAALETSDYLEHVKWKYDHPSAALR